MNVDDLDTPTHCLLWAARETGALDALTDDADTPAEVAGTAGITDRSAELLVRTLTACGFLAHVDGAYEPTNKLLGFLASADIRSISGLPDALDTVEALLVLPETMQTGDPPDQGSLGNRLGARWERDEATVRAVTTAALREARAGASVLDVDGAPGRYATAFAKLGHEVTLADRPDAIARSRPLHGSSAVTLTEIDGDEALPDGFDLVFTGDTVRFNTPRENQTLVTRLAEAATPGGTVVLATIRPDGEAGTREAIAAFAKAGGDVYNDGTFRGWFSAAGLAEPTFVPVPGTDRRLVVGQATN